MICVLLYSSPQAEILNYKDLYQSVSKQTEAKKQNFSPTSESGCSPSEVDGMLPDEQQKSYNPNHYQDKVLYILFAK